MKHAGLIIAVVVGTFVVARAQSAQPRGGDQQQVAQHLATFDDLDVNVFSNQEWDELKKSHAKDIVVHWPDGHITKGSKSTSKI